MSPAKPPMHLGPGHAQFHVHVHLGGVVNPTPSVLQPNDFPPLSMAAESRMPAVGGAWSSGQTKTIVGSQPHGPASVAQSQGGPLSPSPNSGGGGSYGTALFIHGVNGVHGQAGGQYQHPHQPQHPHLPRPRPPPWKLLFQIPIYNLTREDKVATDRSQSNLNLAFRTQI